MPEQITCPICKKPANTQRERLGGNQFVICDRCGEYEITHTLMVTWQESERERLAPALSGLCRELKETNGEPPVLMTTNLEEFVSRFPVPNMDDLDAKLEKLLAAIKRRSDHFGSHVQLVAYQDYPLAYAKNDEEFIAFIDQLVEMGLLHLKGQDTGRKIVSLTIDGFKYFSRIITDQKNKQAFLAAWFDTSMDESIAAIKKAVEECGFNPVCIKTELFKETIMDKALGELRRSRFAVIDLTGSRGSVFYEAGFARALDIEAIYVYREGEAESGSRLEFYVKHYQCHEYASPQDLKEIVMNAIQARIKD